MWLDLALLGRRFGKLLFSLLGPRANPPFLQLVGNLPHCEQRETEPHEDDGDHAHRAPYTSPIEMGNEHENAESQHQAEPDDDDEHVPDEVLARLSEGVPDERTDDDHRRERQESGLEIDRVGLHRRFGDSDEYVGRDHQQNNHADELGPINLGHECSSSP